jgi:phenylpyruvate tautomerase PptA (4-oxalocrotonate tautomerase family)
VKDRALFVLAQSSAPRAQQVIEQIARGAGVNPDLQLKAINYLSQRRKQGAANPNLLPEIYGSTSDVNVKRAIINAWSQSRDKEHLAQAAKNEKSPELRMAAIGALSENNPGQPELWPIFQAETSPEVRQDILRHMYRDGNAEKLAEVVRTEKDSKTRRVAIDVLASQQGAATGDLLVSIYNSEQDRQNKQAIIDRLSNDRSARYLVQLARNEKDSQMKVRIVDRLSNIHSKEASDYLMELLSK